VSIPKIEVHIRDMGLVFLELAGKKANMLMLILYSILIASILVLLFVYLFNFFFYMLFFFCSFVLLFFLSSVPYICSHLTL
jgi:hypothetical protein